MRVSKKTGHCKTSEGDTSCSCNLKLEEGRASKIDRNLSNKFINVVL